MQDTAGTNVLATYSVIGKSYEGRDIGQILIGNSSNSTKQVIFLECGIHARGIYFKCLIYSTIFFLLLIHFFYAEWIAESTCIWILDQVNLSIIDRMAKI